MKHGNKYSYDNLKYLFCKYLTYLELFILFVCIFGNGLDSLYLRDRIYIPSYSLAIFVHVWCSL